jgi:hypothetical protein
MKKLLLACSIIVSSCFFSYAQFNIGGQNGVNVNVGRVCGKINGKPACINPSTGQWEISDGKGGGISGNTNTGQIGIGGTIGGNRFGIGIGGSGAGAANFGNPNGGGVLGILSIITNLVTRAVPILVTLAVLAFFWFIVEFIWKGKDSPEEQRKAKSGIFWSLLALFVMVSVWGIIGFIGGTLGIGQGGGITGFNIPGSK